MQVKFLHVGWKSKVMQKRATFSISISKAIVLGCALTKGHSLFCYLAEDEEKRPIAVVYLDGKPKRNRSDNER